MADTRNPRHPLLRGAWSDDIETVLRAIHLNCNQYADRHKKQHFYLKGYIKYFRIPVLIISGVSSVSSVGLQPFLVQKYISVITCIFGLVCTIITSIELYLQLHSSMENELIAAKQFQLLAADIFKTLSLERENRGIGGISYLDDKFGMFCKYIESSQLVTNRIRDSLKYGDRGEQPPCTAVDHIALAMRSISQTTSGESKTSEDESKTPEDESKRPFSLISTFYPQTPPVQSPHTTRDFPHASTMELRLPRPLSAYLPRPSKKYTRPSIPEEYSHLEHNDDFGLEPSDHGPDIGRVEDEYTAKSADITEYGRSDK